MKKIKAFLIALVLLCSAPVLADDFDWSQCWCNYGAGLKQGDMILSVDAGVPWTFFDAYNNGGWATPYILADFEVIAPIWKLPFSFGGYVGLGLSEYNYYHVSFNHTYFVTGGTANYHVKMPLKELDLYAGLKTGLIMDFSDYYSSGHNINFDFGYTIGASWYFTEMFGLNLELGYPMNKFGVVFKF